MNFAPKMVHSPGFDHPHFIAQAVTQAEEALGVGEVPVGCVLVCDGRIVARTHNLANRESDPLCHAEYQAALEFFGLQDGGVTAHFRLPEGVAPSQLVFYITMEPCVMCHGILERLGATVYFGCYNDIFGTRRLTGKCAGNYIPNPRCVELMREFYTRENTAAPEDRRISKAGRGKRPSASGMPA